MTPVTIGYWDCKGTSEYPKWVASYLGVPFTEKVHDMAWFEKGEKFSLGLDFPNLPYLVDGDFKMSESKAIAYYFAAKANNTEVLGGDLFGQAKVRQILDVMGDVDSEFRKALYGIPNESMVEEIQKAVSEGKIPAKLDQLSKYLGDRKVFVGDSPTLADFYVANLHKFYSAIVRSSGNDCPFRKHENFIGHLKMVLGLPGVAEWTESDKRVPIPGFFFPFPIIDD